MNYKDYESLAGKPLPLIKNTTYYVDNEGNLIPLTSKVAINSDTATSWTSPSNGTVINSCPVNTCENAVTIRLETQEEKDARLAKEAKEKEEKAVKRRQNLFKNWKIKINNPAVILTVGNKKYVSVAKDEPFDEEKGLMMCMLKYLGYTYPDIKIILENTHKQEHKILKEQEEKIKIKEQNKLKDAKCKELKAKRDADKTKYLNNLVAEVIKQLNK